jgi:hypothetical protein
MFRAAIGKQMRLEWPQSENRMNAHHRHGTVAIRTDLLDIVEGTTACSSKVFYGLLAWANLYAHNSSNAEK